jgi:hypothetical protein
MLCPPVRIADLRPRFGGFFNPLPNPVRMAFIMIGNVVHESLQLPSTQRPIELEVDYK